MILIGHKLVPFEPLYKVHTIENIKKTTPNSVILFDFEDEEVLQYSVDNELAFALHVNSLRDAIIANALGAKFILTYNQDISVLIQNIAQEYLFDAKILLYIENESIIEDVARNGIDGIIMRNAIIHI